MNCFGPVNRAITRCKHQGIMSLRHKETTNNILSMKLKFIRVYRFSFHLQSASIAVISSLILEQLQRNMFRVPQTLLPRKMLLVPQTLLQRKVLLVPQTLLSQGILGISHRAEHNIYMPAHPWRHRAEHNKYRKHTAAQLYL